VQQIRHDAPRYRRRILSAHATTPGRPYENVYLRRRLIPEDEGGRQPYPSERATSVRRSRQIVGKNGKTWHELPSLPDQDEAESARDPAI
jgi:hypothetical protein